MNQNPPRILEKLTSDDDNQEILEKLRSTPSKVLVNKPRLESDSGVDLGQKDLIVDG